MKSSHSNWGHVMHIAGWGAIFLAFAFLPASNSYPFILMAFGSLLLGLALAVYQSSCNATSSRQPPVSPSELKRFRIAAWVVLALGVGVFFLIFRYGDSSREIVDQINVWILGPMTAIMWIIMAYALRRFAGACRDFTRQEQDQPDRCSE